MEETIYMYDETETQTKEYNMDFDQIYYELKEGKNPEANLDLLKDAASDDNGHAQYILARYFLTVEKLPSCYRYWLKCSADNGYVPGALEALELFAGDANYMPAMVNWRKTLSNAGDSVSSMKLANMYRTGTLVRKSDVEDLRYLHLAANQNDRTACKRLAQMYRTGKLVEENPELSAFYQQKAKDIKKAKTVKQKYYSLENLGDTIEYLKKTLSQGDKSVAKELILLAANGNKRAAYVTSGIIMGKQLGDVYQQLFWKKPIDETTRKYILMAYPQYQTLMDIVGRINCLGEKGDYTDDVAKLTNIRGRAGLELLTILADMGSEAAMIAAVRLHYQNIPMANYENYLETLECKKLSNEKVYVLLGIHYLCDRNNPGKGKFYLDEGARNYGEAFYAFLDRFVKKGSPDVKYILGCALAFGINGTRNIALANSIKDNLCKKNEMLGYKLASFLENLEKSVA